MDYDASWVKLNASVAAAVSKMGALMAPHTTHRAAYPSALNLGKSAAEHPDSRQRKEAAAEIDAIWLAVKELASGRR